MLAEYAAYLPLLSSTIGNAMDKATALEEQMRVLLLTVSDHLLYVFALCGRLLYGVHVVCGRACSVS